MTAIRLPTGHQQRRAKLSERHVFYLVVGLVAVIFVMINLSLLDSSCYHLSTTNSRSLQQAVAASTSSGKGGSVSVTYQPSDVESFFQQNGRELGLSTPNKLGEGCRMFQSNSTESKIYPKIFDKLQSFRQELEDYSRRVSDFQLPIGIQDLRQHMEDGDYSVCDQLEIHPNGLEGIFKSGSLSNFGQHSSGYVEPLFPPLRHPEFCVSKKRDNLLRLDYLVHDFKAMCRQLKRTSRIVFVDMGASLDFHAGHDKPGGFAKQPAIYITSLFQKVGFKFDHIYAFEISRKEPSRLYQKIPEELMAAYHWINVGVESNPASKLNPLKMVLDNYNEDDFIIIKLDIDTPEIEMPLVYQLLEDSRYGGGMIDSFYFEHHVKLRELDYAWRESMRGSVQSSLQLFEGLRQKGIPAHYWV